jgi:predicted SnoaL-like aldol condensation-catalyzing enzyme
METTTTQDRNKANALAFYELMFNRNDPAAAVERFVGATYRQHNPHVADGAQAFVDYFVVAAQRFPVRHTQFKHVLADGDLVAIHSHQTWPTRDPSDWAVVDIFRFDGSGRIIEHWDVLQAVPAEAANTNTMF